MLANIKMKRAAYKYFLFKNDSFSFLFTPQSEPPCFSLQGSFRLRPARRSHKKRPLHKDCAKGDVSRYHLFSYELHTSLSLTRTRREHLLPFQRSGSKATFRISFSETIFQPMNDPLCRKHIRTPLLPSHFIFPTSINGKNSFVKLSVPLH